jgi:hypothetical protein
MMIPLRRAIMPGSTKRQQKGTEQVRAEILPPTARVDLPYWIEAGEVASAVHQEELPETQAASPVISSRGSWL